MGDSPIGVATDQRTNAINVANSVSGTVSVISGLTNTVIATVPVGTNPEAIAADPDTNRVYAANYESATVSVISGQANTVTDTIPVGAYPVSTAADPATDTIYVGNNISASSGTVSVINGSTGTVTATYAEVLPGRGEAAAGVLDRARAGSGGPSSGSSSFSASGLHACSYWSSAWGWSPCSMVSARTRASTVASWMARLRPIPVAGVNTCAASPARTARPAR